VGAEGSHELVAQAWEPASCRRTALKFVCSSCAGHLHTVRLNPSRESPSKICSCTDAWCRRWGLPGDTEAEGLAHRWQLHTVQGL
jgi:hypothetical protein